ncbi:MAG: hypothetical protein IT204_20820 [Fimbriimonadaceae bacterium]|nr:hypothetical protein [Fimbriimonadaceae bacterium]
MHRHVCWLALLTTALAAAVEVKPVEDAGGEQYKLRCVVGADPEWPGDGLAELRFDVAADGAHYAAQFGALQLRLVRRTADGREVLLGLTNERPPISEQPLRVTLCRERWRIRVLVNGEVWLAAYDDSLPAGGVAVGVSSPKLSITELTAQATEPVFFHDDFMRAADAKSEWEPRLGNWVATGVSEADANQKGGPQAALSSNPFAFRAAVVKGEGLATSGTWFWDNYRFAASVRPAGQGAVGLCFYLQDPQNYLALRWASGSGGGERQLVAVRDGRLEVLAVAPGGWAHDQWYRLTVEVVDNHIQASIDGLPALAADSPLFGQGQVGLWAEGVTFADFDDVEVEACENVVDSFAGRSSGRWQAVSGSWEEQRAGSGLLDPGLRVLDASDGLAVTGSTGWADYRAKVVARAPSGGGIGLAACWQDAKNYLLLRWGDSSAPAAYRNRLQLVRVRDGAETPLGEVAVGFRRDLWHQLSLECHRGFLRARVGDVPVFESFEPELTSGKVGLLGSRKVEFDQLAVDFLPPPAPIEFTAQFTREDTMADWASAAGNWEVAQSASRRGVFWHRGEFHGDSQMSVQPALFGKEARSLRLVLAGVRPGERAAAAQPAAPAAGAPAAGAPPLDPVGGGGGPAEVIGSGGGAAPNPNDADGGGYALVLAQDKANSTRLLGQIELGGQAVKRAAFDVAGAEAITFARRGRYLLVYKDEECVLGHLDQRPQAASGLHAAISGISSQLELDRVDARASQMFDTTFVKAPWEWYVAKGTWETINRWKCDPRWSFFGGFNDLHPLIWSKQDYAGDVQVEAYLAIRMDMPGPPYYLHPSDLCITLGGDGKDVLSGLTLVYAGRNNTASMLYRKGREIAVNTKPEARFEHTGPQGEGLTKFHRHWFHLVLRKAGGRIKASVDDHELFDVPDDGSLTSGKVAVFGVNNGVMVSRVKVWYEQLPPRVALPDIGALQATANPGEVGGNGLQNDFGRGIGACRPADPRTPLKLDRSGEGGGALAVTNLASGGKFAVQMLDTPFRLAERPNLKFRYRVPAAARLNLYLLIRGVYHVVKLNGGVEVGDNQRFLSELPGFSADDRWHDAGIDLKAACEKLYPGVDLTVEKVVIGLLGPDPYLHAGFGVNHFGTTWYLDDWLLGP